jgi:hypothetical protein
MLSCCIFWCTIIFYIILCESASIRREGGVPASYFSSAGRWRPGRPLKRSLFLNDGNIKDTPEAAAEDTILQAQPQTPAGVAKSLGPQADGQSNYNSFPSIVYLPELNLNGIDNIPMYLADGFDSDLQSPIDEKELNSMDKNALFLMLNSNGENFINNQALKNEQPSYIIPENSKPAVIQQQLQKTAALSTAQHHHHL